MRVGFDVSPLHRPHPCGVVRVVAGLVGALERRGRIEVVRLAPDPSTGSARWRQVELPRAEARLALDGVHCCVSAFPLRGAGKRVSTVHELPWLHGVAENAGWRHRLWARLGPSRADAVVTATERTARDVRAYSGADERRVRVIPWGHDGFGAQDPGALERLGLARGGYVLCAGGGRAKKRPESALRGAVELARRGGPSLAVVVTGAVERDTATRAGGAHFVGDVDDATLAALYAGAAAAAVLAPSEGFGLPALEACAAGTPVLVTRGSAQAEVAGAGGIAVDADDATSVADGLARALASGDAERAARVARAAEFTWDRSAALVEELWADLCR